MAILPKVIYRLNAIPIEVLTTFFTELEKSNPKIYMDPEEPRMADAILREEKQ